MWDGGEMVNKTWLVYILAISSLIMLPNYAYGEEQNNEKRGLLSGTITQLIDKTENITEEVNSTLNNTLPVQQIEEITTLTQPVVKIVEEVEDKTNTIVEQALIEVPPITESVVSEVGSLVEETVEVVPELPIVTPVLTEVSGSVKKVTNKVQETVEEGSSTVQAVISKKEIPIPEEKSPVTVQPQKQVEEPRTTDTEPLVEETKIPQESPIPAASLEESVPVLQEIPQQSQPTVEEIRLVVEKESHDVLQVNEEKKQIGIVDKNEIKKSTNKSPTVLPPIPDKQKKKVVVTTIPTTSTSAPSSTSNSVIVQGGDTLFALTPSQEPMKELMRKKWYHKNHYAIIQWIHTPLRKPPEMTPFYT